MSFNGSGTFNINTAGQPVVDDTVIDATVFNALTADLASGLSTCITKDGQQTPTANIPMGGFRITGVGIGTADTDAATVKNVNSRDMCEGRLTLTSGTPVTTSDVTAAETLYFTPYKGNCIALYNGTNWVRMAFSEASIDVPDATGVYDVFAYDDGFVVALEVLAWTNDTTRATALTKQDGVLVKTGALTRRYLGTFYSTTAGNGQIEDSAANRYLWNYYNRVPRLMRALEATNSWNYSTATFRQANNSSANQLNFVCGVSESIVQAELVASASCSAAGESLRVGIGLDSTSALATGCIVGWDHSPVINMAISVGAKLKTYPAIGKHYLAWLEYSTAGGTTTWYGDNNAPTLQQSGIHGEIMG